MLSLHALERMWPEWINEDGMHLTNYDIAVRANCKDFMDKQRNYMCFRAQQERWTGDIRYTGHWNLSPEAWAIILTMPWFWPLFLFTPFCEGILEDPPKLECRRLPAQRYGLLMRWWERPTTKKDLTEKVVVTRPMMQKLEAFVLFQIAPVTKFVRHSVFYLFFVLLMSVELLGNPVMPPSGGGRPYGWLRSFVLAFAISINLHQYKRIYQVRCLDVSDDFRLAISLSPPLFLPTWFSLFLSVLPYVCIAVFDFWRRSQGQHIFALHICMSNDTQRVY